MTDEERISVTFVLSKRVIAALDDIAQAEQMSRDSVVMGLLGYALTAYGEVIAKDEEIDDDDEESPELGASEGATR